MPKWRGWWALLLGAVPGWRYAGGSFSFPNSRVIDSSAGSAGEMHEARFAEERLLRLDRIGIDTLLKILCWLRGDVDGKDQESGSQNGKSGELGQFVQSGVKTVAVPPW